MINYLHSILDGKAAASTINSRIRYLNNLSKIAKDPTDIRFLNDADKVLEVVKKNPNVNTQWTGLMHINAAVKADPSKITQKATDTYRSYIASIKDARIEKNLNNNRTEKQAAKYLPLQELKDTINNEFQKLLAQKDMTNTIDIRKVRRAVGDLDFVKKYQQLLIIAVYVLQPPLRNDWFALKMINKLGDATDPKSNYIYIKSKSKIKLILNHYKTAYITGTTTIDIEDANLRKYISGWAKIINVLLDNPERFMGYLITKNTITYNPNTETTRRGMAIISNKLFGKPLTINDFRHIYEIDLQTDPEYAKMTQAERNAEHAKLLHSTPTAQLYNVH